MITGSNHATPTRVGVGVKTVKTNNEDSILGSNVYKISTMGNSITKPPKSLNLSSNYCQEDPTHAAINFSNNASIPTHAPLSLLVQKDEVEQLEDIHLYLVAFQQKKKNLLTKLERKKSKKR